MTIETDLCRLARKYGTDKGGNHLQAGDTCHNYTPAYHELFKDRREQVRYVLEIGIGHGCSLRMWKDYFPQAQIVGIDTNTACLFIEDRIHCFMADQYNGDDLMIVIKNLLNHPKFDLIIDDGSHEPAHQIFSAQMLLPYLAHDGIYVIEDVFMDCQPQLIGNPIVNGRKDYVWKAIPVGHGLGRAHCECGRCSEGEQLIVIRHV